jgi:DNA primase
VNVVSLPDNDDPDTFLKKNGYEAFASCLRKSEKFMDFVLGQGVKGGPATSIDEKVEKAGKMLGYIARLPSGIERDHYLKRTAEALDLDEGVLRQEMPRQGKGPVHHETDKTTPATLRGHKPKAEEILIHLMLKDEMIARSLQERIKPQDFTDPLYRRAAAKIFEVLDSHCTFTVNALLAEGDEELNHIISHYSVLEMVYDNPEKSCQDCVELIKQQDPEKKMKQIIRAIKEAELRGDSAELLRLIEEQNDLSKRPGRRIHGL